MKIDNKKENQNKKILYESNGNLTKNYISIFFIQKDLFMTNWFFFL